MKSEWIASRPGRRHGLDTIPGRILTALAGVELYRGEVIRSVHGNARSIARALDRLFAAGEIKARPDEFTGRRRYSVR